MLIDRPAAGNVSKAPANEIGMPSVTQKARRASRKRPRISNNPRRDVARRAGYDVRFCAVGSLTEAGSTMGSGFGRRPYIGSPNYAVPDVMSSCGAPKTAFVSPIRSGAL